MEGCCEYLEQTTANSWKGQPFLLGVWQSLTDFLPPTASMLENLRERLGGNGVCICISKKNSIRIRMKNQSHNFVVTNLVFDTSGAKLYYI
jgi:hypothetical protein